MSAPSCLLVTFPFPPMTGSSGVFRPLYWARHLSSRGWRVTVLTCTAGAYPSTSADQLHRIPADVRVIRTPALDVRRHLSLFGRYPARLAIPDRWGSWFYSAVFPALQIARRMTRGVVFSTYPIATAHRIAAAVAARSGLPWVAEFRDPMLENDYPRDPSMRRALGALEAKVVQAAAGIVVTTPGAQAMYRARYPQLAADKCHTIFNGYDEDVFAALSPRPAQKLAHERVTLLHSGAIYGDERDPGPLFEALGRLRAAKVIEPRTFQLVLRASGDEHRMATMLARHGLADIVESRPAVPQSEAVAEMLGASALLVLQAGNCNSQIPAKLYEYFRTGLPILGLTDAQGDTASAMRDVGVDSIAPLDSADAIESALGAFLSRLREGNAPTPDASKVSRYSRARQAEQLEVVLQGALQGSSPFTPH